MNSILLYFKLVFKMSITWIIDGLGFPHLFIPESIYCHYGNKVCKFFMKYKHISKCVIARVRKDDCLLFDYCKECCINENWDEFEKN